MVRGAGQTANGKAKGKGKAVETIEVESDVEWDYQEEEQDQVLGTAEEQETLDKLERELSDIENQIAKLRNLYASIRTERETLRATIQSRQSAARQNGGNIEASSSRSVQGPGVVDFEKDSFPWSTQAKQLAQSFFKIKDWRFCQEAAINAAMSKRDVVVVMPTGGGKSLIYQVPALLSPGTTVVVTPLISLMTDQVSNLREKNISAEAIHAATTQPERRAILKRMLGSAGAPKKGKKKVEDEDEDGEEVRMAYVTPEQIEKSKTFMSTLQKMYDAGILARFVIDEAHCVTMSGHDYRPSYLSLERLKVLFPKVPILAVTATAPTNVINDMIKTLGLPRKTSRGNAALPNSTVLFSAPLYRANLNWSVVPKAAKADAAIEAIVDWILDNHAGETGIVYCLSRADSENVAKVINSSAKCRGKLRAAVYHAYIEDADKIKVHEQWRDKKIQVVCATNASFGLGIDNGSVRYVVHHTLAKSLANYYQEGGRAGRDGLASDCITFFRAADASRVSTLVYATWRNGGRDKLYEMLQFAQDLTTCRKVLFARYFASTYENGTAFEEDGGEDPCGSCDNCSRDPGSVKTLDISEQAYRAIRIIDAAVAQRGTLTLPQAVDLVRGNGGGSFSTQDKNSKSKGHVKVDEVAGGKVTLSKDETETMMIKLLIDGWLEETFNVTAYAVNSYLKPSSVRSTRFTRLSPQEVKSSGLPVVISMEVLSTSSGKGKKRKSASTTKEPPKKRKVGGSSKKGQLTEVVTDYEDDDNGDDDSRGSAFYGAEEDDDEIEAMMAAENEPMNGSDEILDDDGWSKVVKNESGKAKKQRISEVIELD